MRDHKLVSLSRILSLVLRHKPDVIGVQWDWQGWIDMDQLVEAAKRYGKPLVDR